MCFDRYVLFSQDDVMLPQRVRLQHEASLLHPNSVSSPSSICLLTSFPLCCALPWTLLLFLSLSLDIWPVPPLKKKYSCWVFVVVVCVYVLCAPVCVCALSCSWHAEQCEYPVLMLSEACQVRGRRLCVWGKWGRQHGDSRLAALHKQPAPFCYRCNIL